MIIENLTRRNEVLAPPFKSVAVIGQGQIGTMLRDRLQANQGLESSFAVRGQIERVMAGQPDVVIFATPNPVDEVVYETAQYATFPFVGVFPQNGVRVMDQAMYGLRNTNLPVALVRASLFTTVNGVSYNPDKLRIALAARREVEEVLTLPRVARLFKDLGFKVVTTDNYQAQEWTKLLTNTVGATSTVTGLTPLETFTDRELFELELRGLQDRVKVMEAALIYPLNIPWAKTPVLRLAAKHLPSKLPDQVRRFVAKAIASSRDNQPSAAARKIMEGKKPIEALEYHRPYVTLGQQLEVSTPVDQALFEIISAHNNGDINLQTMPFDVKRRLLLDTFATLVDS